MLPLRTEFKPMEDFLQRPTQPPPEPKRGVMALIVDEAPDPAWVFLITRKHTDFMGMVGGTVEPGEEYMDTLIREVLEETGVATTPEDYHPTPLAVGVDDEGNFCVTYLYTGDPLRFTGGISPEGETMEWADFHRMYDPRVTPFWQYNEVVWDTYDQRLRQF